MECSVVRDNGLARRKWKNDNDQHSASRIYSQTTLTNKEDENGAFGVTKETRQSFGVSGLEKSNSQHGLNIRH